MIRPISLAMAIASLAAMGCTTHVSKSPSLQSAAQTLPSVQATIEHLEREDTWRVDYRFAKPVSAAHFLRPSKGVRDSHWQVPSAFELDHLEADQGDVVRRRDGQPFSQLTLTIRAYYETPEKDYQLLVPDTGGATLVYTGHLNVAPDMTMEFVPRAREQLILQGQVHRGRTSWRAIEDGTYVYFGASAPIETDRFTAVLDPGAPPWLIERMQRLLPKLFAFYTDRLGYSLPFKPFVFLSYGETSKPTGISMNGGTLPGLVMLNIGLGKDRRQKIDAEIEERAIHLFAHEAAHLWNMQVFHHSEPMGVAHGEGAPDWIWEGSADAFADRALFALGEIGQARLLERFSEDLSRCLFELDGQPLRAVSTTLVKSSYRCGSTIALWTEIAIRDGRRDLFSFWKEIFTSSTNHIYNFDIYEKTLRRLDPGGHSVDGIRSLLNGPTADLADRLRADWHKHGIELETSGHPSSDYDREVGRRAVVQAILLDCGTDSGLSAHHDYYLLEQAGGCRTLPPEFRIARLGPHDVFDAGSEAYDYLVAACAKGANVSLGTSAAPAFFVTCTQLVHPRPPWFRISKYE